MAGIAAAIAKLGLLALLAAAASGRAAVDDATAERLGRDLTPVGAERAGDASGAIPAWTGGLAQQPAPADGVRPDPFADDRPLFSITAATAKSYEEHLPEGALALFALYPDYRMDIYPTRRSASFPPALYAATRRNATSASAAPAGITKGIAGAAGGFPFPIPRSGGEAVWNHLLAYWGPAREDHVDTYATFADGKTILTADEREAVDFPYYYPDATPASVGAYYFSRRLAIEAPADQAGQAYLTLQPLEPGSRAVASWEYLPGQRRVRRAPSLAYDTPNPAASGLESFDDYYIFSGAPDRYDWRLIGKRALYVPYNNNRLHALPIARVLGGRHAEPDALRYELHRVWVVEGTLAPGERHISPRRRLYLDEDTWIAVYAEAWDEQGRLRRFSHATMYDMPDLPAVVLGSQFVYDLVDRAYLMDFAFNAHPGEFHSTPPHPADLFTPEALAAAGTR